MEKRTMQKLGIIAGNGSLPICLIRACQKEHRPFFVVALKGHACPADFSQLDPGMIAWARVGSFGRILTLLKKEKVTDVIFIGGVRRPSLAEIFPDWAGFCFLLRHRFRMKGDDSLLKSIVREVESKKIHVLGIDSIMPSLLTSEGVYGSISPDIKDREDIERGFQVAKLLGQADVGQAVIVQRGLVLSLEGIEGTAALIHRTASLKRKGQGGVLVKVSKPQQDRRMDLPTVGPDTVQAVFDAGLKGIAVESGGTLMVDADKIVALADRLGIFVVGVNPGKDAHI